MGDCALDKLRELVRESLVGDNVNFGTVAILGGLSVCCLCVSVDLWVCLCECDRVTEVITCRVGPNIELISPLGK